MLCPARFVVDATENIKEGGVAAEVCSSQTGLWFCTFFEILMHVYERTNTYDPIYSAKKKKRSSGLGMDT